MAHEVAGVLWVWQEWKMKNEGLDHNMTLLLEFSIL